MKNLHCVSRLLLYTNLLGLRKFSKPASFVLVILSCLLLNKNSFAQSYSLSTTGAIPDSSAMLDIISNNKGLLIPRVYLLSVTDSATIAHPAVSLQVYNTNNTVGKGFWYWDGTKWIRQTAALGTDSLVVGSATSSHLYNLQVTGTAGISGSLKTPLIVGGSGTTDSLMYKTTTGNGTTGADHIFKVGNNGGTEAMRVLNGGSIAKMDVNCTWSSNQMTAFGIQQHQIGDLNRVSLSNGGLLISGYSKHSSTSTVGIYGVSYVENEPTTNGAYRFNVYKHDGSGALTSIASTSGFFRLFNNTTNVFSVYGGGSTVIGTTLTAGTNLQINKTITGSTAANVVYVNGVVQSDVTAGCDVFITNPNTAASSFTLPYIAHYSAYQGSTLGSGSALTNQYGFRVYSNLTRATNNYGFYGDIAFGTNRWNLYMNGTAQNYLAGDLGIGVSAPAYKLQVAVSNTNTTFPNSDAGMAVQNTSSTTGNYSTIGFVNSGSTADAVIGAVHHNHLTGSTTRRGSLVFATSNSSGLVERMRIDTNGYVGMRTTTPKAPLDLGGNMFFEWNATSLPTDKDAYIGIIRTSSGGSAPFDQAGSMILRPRVESTSGRSSIYFYTGSPTTQRARFDEIGRFIFTSENTTGTTTSSAMSLSGNSLTTGTGVYAASSSLTTGKLMDLQVSGTAADNNQTALNILTTGTATSKTTYGAQISNTHSGTSNTNYALYLNASGGTTNYAVYANAGDVLVSALAGTGDRPVKADANGVLGIASNSTLTYEAALTLSSSQIKALNGTPLTIVSAPGSGKYIQVVSASFEYTHVSLAYTGNTTVQLITSGAGVAQATVPNILGSTASRTVVFDAVSSSSVAGTTATQLISNTALTVFVPTGNPGTGDGTAKVKVLYRIVTI